MSDRSSLPARPPAGNEWLARIALGQCVEAGVADPLVPGCRRLAIGVDQLRTAPVSAVRMDGALAWRLCMPHASYLELGLGASAAKDMAA